MLWLSIFASFASGNEIIFRSTTQWVSNKPRKTQRISEWRLNLPNQFTTQNDAYNSRTYEFGKTNTWKPWVRFPDGASMITVLASLNADEEVVPLDVYRTIPEFSFSLGNHVGRGERFAPDYCVTKDVVFQNLPQGRCTATPVCEIYMSLHGWPVSVGVPREGLYKTPDRVCQILKKTLSAWTIKIDDLRADHSESR